MLEDFLGQSPRRFSCDKMKSPFGISSIHTPLLLRSASLRLGLSEQVAISGTLMNCCGGYDSSMTLL